jgi:hypothetical protein
LAEIDMQSGARDFDFLVGSWDIANERLLSRLSGSDEWERFPASGQYELILGGIGNADSFSTTRDGFDFEGYSLRLFNPATGKWSIYWADNVGCVLLPPVVGAFHDGTGEFFGTDTHARQPVQVRFRWSDISAGGALWEQAFSIDDGETWETNWIMHFTRRKES